MIYTRTHFLRKANCLIVPVWDRRPDSDGAFPHIFINILIQYIQARYISPITAPDGSVYFDININDIARSTGIGIYKIKGTEYSYVKAGALDKTIKYLSTARVSHGPDQFNAIFRIEGRPRPGILRIRISPEIYPIISAPESSYTKLHPEVLTRIKSDPVAAVYGIGKFYSNVNRRSDMTEIIIPADEFKSQIGIPGDCYTDNNSFKHNFLKKLVAEFNAAALDVRIEYFIFDKPGSAGASILFMFKKNKLEDLNADAPESDYIIEAKYIELTKQIEHFGVRVNDDAVRNKLKAIMIDGRDLTTISHAIADNLAAGSVLTVERINKIFA